MRLCLNHTAEKNPNGLVLLRDGPAPCPLLPVLVCEPLLSSPVLLPSWSWFWCLDASQSQSTLFTWLQNTRFCFAELVFCSVWDLKKRERKWARVDAEKALFCGIRPLRWPGCIIEPQPERSSCWEIAWQWLSLLSCCNPETGTKTLRGSEGMGHTHGVADAALQGAPLCFASCPWVNAAEDSPASVSPGWVAPLFTVWCSCARNRWILLIQALFSIFPKGADSAH